MPQYDVLVVGGVGIDTIVRVPSLSLPCVDSIQVPPVRDYVGHTGNGVALGCHALGLRTKFIDFIGEDPQAALILARYRQTGLDFSHLVHASGTRRAVNLVDPQGRRLSLYDRRHPDSLRMPRDFHLPFLRAARHAHFSIMNWTRELYDDAFALGVTVSTDLHNWNGTDDYHRDFALRSDLVFMSTAALQGRHEQIMCEVLQQGRAQAVIAMAGEHGSYLLAHDDPTVRHFACAELQRPVVDSNGAGDSFVAAFLFAHFQGQPLEACMRAGAVAGAYACGCHGTHEEFITRELLERYCAA
ncbi:carbohydrate kinase family protein [Herbaspirillum sp. ST 5-3]|uniref:carbohydrate kinase family protein n=1 Tax=Oxalobacteraceae TaxID=75682 RepID=UPI0010A39CD2|nr:carbohydrate kinase family protein [Herbaspirillum sp. ST 5-3]